MATLPATVVSHAGTVSDKGRARELYKYFQPAGFTLAPGSIEAGNRGARAPAADIPQDKHLYHESPPPANFQSKYEYLTKTRSPDPILTAFCQLVSWRTGAQRAMISFIDGDMQYIIAESTKTLDLIDSTSHDLGDDLFIGRVSRDRGKEMCETTIALPPTTNGEYPYFRVNDLSEDERFQTLPFVKGAPFFKFYTGVPLITKRGIPIGTLAVLDDRSHLKINKTGLHFMGSMATTIIQHMEMVREMEQHRRAMKMTRSLASFIEGRFELAESEVQIEKKDASYYNSKPHLGLCLSKSKMSPAPRDDPESHIHQDVRRASAIGIESRQVPFTPSLLASHSRRESIPGIEAHRSAMHPQMTLQTPEDEENPIRGSLGIDAETSAIKQLFSRAANLIKSGFGIDGGVVFYDLQKGFSNPNVKLGRTEVSLEENQINPKDASSLSDSIRDSLNPPSGREAPVNLLNEEGLPSWSSCKEAKALEVLGFSTPAAASVYGDHFPGSNYPVSPIESFLHDLTHRYPRGNLWTFDSDGFVSSSADTPGGLIPKLDTSQASEDKTRSERLRNDVKNDARLLMQHFPGVCQLLFVPLWDASRSRWLSACFAWSTNPTKVLSPRLELAFLNAFGNSVMAEFSRLETEIANQKKDNFIGSISHELRSPLHGILASSEFLQEEVNSTFAKGLVETIDSCGRTLLDTINHILDYSKINHFQRNHQKSKNDRLQHLDNIGKPISLCQADLSMINIFADINISTVCEEVVGGVLAGHKFGSRGLNKSSFIAPSKMTEFKTPMQPSSITKLEAQLTSPDVSVILDIKANNYFFTTQPGAIRRVIMNLLGNSLKYTSQGYVHIKLETEDIEGLYSKDGEHTPRSMVKLTIVDSGRGISNEFLRSKLFIPFAQENSLSSGTGLGLAIVKGIITSLGGMIAIDSEQGSGTRVKVSLPLLRRLPAPTDSPATKTTALTNCDYDECIIEFRAKFMGQKVSLCGFETDNKDTIECEAVALLKKAIENIVSNWCCLQVVALEQNPDIIIANEAKSLTTSKLSLTIKGTARTPTFLVIGSFCSRLEPELSSYCCKRNIGFMAKPVGPLKLAKALLQCFGSEGQSLPSRIRSNQVSLASETCDPNRPFKQMIPDPQSGKVLDNSAIASDGVEGQKHILDSMESTREFPFQTDDSPEVSQLSSCPGLSTNLKLEKPERHEHGLVSGIAPDMSQESAPIQSMTSTTPLAKDRPALLIVDDNCINLTLLRTFLRKLKFELVQESENGLDAVKRVQERIDKGEKSYDIIFMDINMPVMDGFEATRRIRALELLESHPSSAGLAAADIPSMAEGGVRANKTTRSCLTKNNMAQQPKFSPRAFIVALTGLASREDQSDAYKSGIDLFLTKPVSFKEIRKILNNWYTVNGN